VEDEIMTGRRITGRRVATLAAAGAVGLTLVACGAGPGEQPDTAGQTVPVTVEQAGATGDAERLPEELRADLEALRDLPAEQRRAAAEDMRDSALAGEYGEDAQQRAERLSERAERLAERRDGRPWGDGPLAQRFTERFGD
jgi:hypothetical protein